jgi:hypothetical protein
VSYRPHILYICRSSCRECTALQQQGFSYHYTVTVASVISSWWVFIWYIQIIYYMLISWSAEFLPWKLRRYFAPVSQFTYRLHGAICQKTSAFITSAVRTAKPTIFFTFHYDTPQISGCCYFFSPILVTAFNTVHYSGPVLTSLLPADCLLSQTFISTSPDHWLLATHVLAANSLCSSN